MVPYYIVQLDYQIPQIYHPNMILVSIQAQYYIRGAGRHPSLGFGVPGIIVRTGPGLTDELAKDPGPTPSLLEVWCFPSFREDPKHRIPPQILECTSNKGLMVSIRWY